MVKVLFPLDGSERSLQAMENGLRLLEGANVEATLLCVQHQGFHGAPEDLVEMFEEDTDDEIFPTEDSALLMLKKARKRCKDLGVAAKPEVVEGNVRKAIKAAAENHDLVVMHRLNRSGFGEKLKMSGTEYLARNLKTSVLLVDD